MIYAYDEPVQLPVRDLYDTQIMAMAINTAKDMYEKGQLEMKDFAKTYGDFYTPIINDQNWFDLNVTGRLRGALDEIYSLGINPLTNPLARVFLLRIINTMPYGDIAKVRLSADNAREFLKAKQRLWLEGKYNPLYDKYDGPSLSDYATVGDNGLGIWERLSPTPIQDMATFGNPYYEGMKPNIRSESRNGIQYKVESITMDDLKAIADSHFNELVNTPQGQLMYKYYKDLYGGDSNPNSGQQAREAFNSAVAEGQKRRTYTNSDYEDNYYKALQLAQGWARIKLDREEFEYRKQKDAQDRKDAIDAANNKGGKGGRNYFLDQFDRGIQSQTYGEAGSPPETAAQVKKNSSLILESTRKATKGLFDIPSYSDSRWIPARDLYLAANVREGIIDPTTLAKASGRPLDNGKTDCVFVSPGDIDRFHSDNDVVSHTFGAKGHKHFLRTTNGELSKYKPNGEKESKLKMQFSRLTYTAPIVDKNNNVRMVLYQKVHLYEHQGYKGGKKDSEGNAPDLYLGDKWYALYESDPTPGVKRNGKILYKTVPTTISEDNAGYVLPWSSEAEHILHSTADGKYNPLVRN